MKNKALHRSATSIYNKLVQARTKWARQDIQYQSQTLDTKAHLEDSIQSMKFFLDSIS